MQPHNASHWINHLQLLPHPEGGYYKEVFRSANNVIRAGETTPKSACTSIYYLLEGTDFSGFHRIVSDETWYFHKGVPLSLHIIDKLGTLTSVELSDKSSGSLSLTVNGGDWFAAELPSKTGFTLASCAVAPGFEFTEFQLAKKEELLTLYPLAADAIKRLCRK